MQADNYTPVKTIGNGVTTEFSFSFDILAAANIRVYLESVATGVQTLQTDGADYTLVFSESGGTATFAAAPSNEYYVVIGRVTPNTQDVPYFTSKGFQAKVVERSLDKLTAMIQDRKEELDRSPKAPLGTTVEIKLPSPENSKAIAWKSDAETTGEMENVENPTDAMERAETAAEEAEAAQLAAETSETNSGLSETNAEASAAAAASAAAEGLYNDVVSKAFADSPIAPILSEEGTLYKIDTSGGNVVVNLDELADYGEDMKYAFVKTTSDANTVTINPGGTDTINGEASYVMSTQYIIVVLVGGLVTEEWITAVQTDLPAASIAQVNAGSSNSLSVTPDNLAGSNLGQRLVQLVCFDFTSEVTTGDGAGYFVIPAALNGMNLVSVHARVITAGTTGTTDIQIHNVTQSKDMLSTKLTIDSTETGSDTAATPAVINTSNDDVASNNLIRIDVDAVSTTKPKGLVVTMGFQLP